MTAQETEALRKQVKHGMIDCGLDREGSYDRLLPYITAAAGFPVSKSQLSMALTGYRNGQRHHDILAALRSILENWSAPVREFIHDPEKENNQNNAPLEATRVE